MKKLLTLLLLAITTMAIFFGLNSGAQAAFLANDIIDDSVFDNVNTSANAGQIDSWLNANFPSSCISTNNGFSAPDVTGYSPTGASSSPTGGFSYGGDVSAGTIIYHASQVYGLNPQVILTTLQKEQSLVSGTSGCSVLRYTAAMGYNCPDNITSNNYSGFELYSLNGTPVTSVSGTCVKPNQYGNPSYVGFSRQVIIATWQFKFDEQRSEGNISWNVQRANYPNAGNTWDNSDDPQSCYSHRMTQGFRQVCPGGPTNYYDGYTTIDGSSVHIDTGATAALYNYTPHFAGNQNFVNIFNSWFGSTIGSLMVRNDSSDTTEYLVDGTTKYPIASLVTATDYGILGPIQRVSSSFLDSSYSTTGPVLTNFINPNSAGSIFFVTAGIKLYFPTPQLQTDYGGTTWIPLSTSLTDKLFNGPSATQIIKSPSNGTIYYMSNGKKRPIPGWGDLTSLINPISYNVLGDASTNSFPTGDLMFGQGSLVKASNSGTVYVVKSPTELYTITSFAYPSELGITSGLRTTNDLSDYSVSGSLQNLIKCGANYYDGIGGSLYQVTFPANAATTAYAYNSGQFVVGDSNGGTLCSALNTGGARPLIQYLRASNGTIYYVSFNGSSNRSEKQAFTNFSAYTNHQTSDGNPGYIQADDFFLNQIANGANITN